MKDAQEVFSRLEDLKKKLKEYNQMFKQELEAIPEYVDLAEKRRTLNEKIKVIRVRVGENNPDLYNKIEDTKIDIDSDKQMLSDILLTKYVKGEEVKLMDQYNNPYQLTFKFIAKKE